MKKSLKIHWTSEIANAALFALLLLFLSPSLALGQSWSVDDAVWGSGVFSVPSPFPSGPGTVEYGSGVSTPPGLSGFFPDGEGWVRGSMAYSCSIGEAELYRVSVGAGVWSAGDQFSAGAVMSYNAKQGVPFDVVNF